MRRVGWSGSNGLLLCSSSGRWFEGWKRSARAIVAEARERPGIHAIATPHTWLLHEGWKKAGPLRDAATVPG